MNVHEHQAKEILKEFGAPVSKGIVIYSKDQIKDKISEFEKQTVCSKSSDTCWRER